MATIHDKLTAIADAIRTKTGNTELLSLDAMASEISGIQVGGGNGELNFSIVGGTTQPTSPNENTIWVNTSTDISGWVLSVEQPTNPVSGMVWIETDDYSDNTFNAVKSNELRVYPIFVKQYIDGSWQIMNAQIFQNNNWNSFWNGELFVSGNQYTSITGGWDGNGWTTTHSFAQIIGGTLSGNTCVCTNNGVEDSPYGMFSGNKINLRKYNTLSVTISAIGANVHLIVNNEKKAPTYFEDSLPTAYKTIAITGTHTLSVADINEGYIAVYGWSTGGTSTLKITDIHLE